MVRDVNNRASVDLRRTMLEHTGGLTGKYIGVPQVVEWSQGVVRWSLKDMDRPIAVAVSTHEDMTSAHPSVQGRC